MVCLSWPENDMTTSGTEAGAIGVVGASPPRQLLTNSGDPHRPKPQPCPEQNHEWMSPHGEMQRVTEGREKDEPGRCDERDGDHTEELACQRPPVRQHMEDHAEHGQSEYQDVTSMEDRKDVLCESLHDCLATFVHPHRRQPARTRDGRRVALAAE